MFVLLAAATSMEIRTLTARLEAGKSRIGSHEAATLITGVGSLSTAYSLMQSLHHRRPDLVIQGGIAGTFAPGKAEGGAVFASDRVIDIPGRVVAIREEIPADLGVWENGVFRSVFDLGLADPRTTPFSDGMLVNPYSNLLAFTGLQSVRAASVNEISTDPGRITWLQQNLRPVVESMEGAALHYVCLGEDIPFLQIRSISNTVGVRDKSKWSMGKALDDLNTFLIGLLERLPLTSGDLLKKNLS